MRFHDLRHTFATELLRQGVDVHRVQRLMRHSDVRVTTGTYSHLLVEDLRAAVDAHAPKPSVPPPTEPPLAAFLLHEAGSEAKRPRRGHGQPAQARGGIWWALQDSNLRSLPCERPKRGWQGGPTSGKL